MAPPPPALPNGNLSNGMKNNVMSPPMMGGLLKEIETGNCFNNNHASAITNVIYLI